MSNVEEIKYFIKENPLQDILISGFLNVYQEDVKRFHPQLSNIYLQFGEKKLIKCSSINQFESIKLTIVEQIDFEFDMECYRELCFCSISELNLKTPYWERYVKSIHFFLNENSNPENSIFACIGISLYNDNYLFLDPTHIFGIQIGDYESQLEWKKEYFDIFTCEEIIWNTTD